jgi:predicted acylesterase/phospholipase RssA
MSEQPTGTQPECFGFSLSGGGFRATLFHLGAVRLLYEADLLRHVRFISGVSGGAILAAHLALNWDRYTGGPNEFEAAAMEIVRFTQKDVRNRILRRWIIGWLTLFPRIVCKWSRVELLRREYQSLYGDRKFSEFPNVYEGNGPRVTIQCTSMTTGLPCSFGRSGLMLYKEQADGRGIKLDEDKELTFATRLSVAYGVAASSAFPPMFPPLQIDSKMLDCPEESFTSQHYLSDGGVFDNLGMDRPLWWYLQHHDHLADQIKNFLIIDAEGPFNQIDGRPWRYKFMLPRNVRATEVLMKRSSTLNWKFLSGLPLNLVRIPEPRLDSDSPTELELVQGIRTDLDRFSDLELEALVRSGYSAARSALAKRGWISSEIPESLWHPVPPPNLTRPQRERKLHRARFRRWMPLLFGYRDWAWWISLTILCAFLLYLYASHD